MRSVYVTIALVLALFVAQYTVYSARLSDMPWKGVIGQSAQKTLDAYTLSNLAFGMLLGKVVPQRASLGLVVALATAAVASAKVPFLLRAVKADVKFWEQVEHQSNTAADLVAVIAGALLSRRLPWPAVAGAVLACEVATFYLRGDNMIINAVDAVAPKGVKKLIENSRLRRVPFEEYQLRSAGVSTDETTFSATTCKCPPNYEFAEQIQNEGLMLYFPGGKCVGYVQHGTQPPQVDSWNCNFPVIRYPSGTTVLEKSKWPKVTTSAKKP